MRFRISLRAPSHGWLGISIDFFEHGQFECAASDTPNDFLGELTYAIYRVLQLGSPVSAIAHVEPGAYEFRFSTQPESYDILLQVIEHADLQNIQSNQGTELLKIGGGGDRKAICQAFLWAIEELKKSSEPNNYRSRDGWAWSFPDAGLYNIKLLLEGWPTE